MHNMKYFYFSSNILLNSLLENNNNNFLLLIENKCFIPHQLDEIYLFFFSVKDFDKGLLKQYTVEVLHSSLGSTKFISI